MARERGPEGRGGGYIGGGGMEENDRNGWDHQHRLSPSYSSSVELKVVLLGGVFFFNFNF